jgi:hypothetical protein
MQTFRFESKSTPGFFHDAVLGDDGSASCSCKGFQYSKVRPQECTHTRAILATLEGRALPKPMTNVRQSPIAPMLASPLPEEKSIDDYSPHDWLLEEKFDGHRLIVRTTAFAPPEAWSRLGNVREIPPHIATALSHVDAGMYDAELIIPGGTATDVKDLSKQAQARLMIFDLLEVEGTSLLAVAAEARRRGLVQCLRLVNSSAVALVPQEEPSRDGLHRIWDRGGEGAILKRRAVGYAAGRRSKDWVKFKRFESHALRVIGFQHGRLGPFSIILLVDEDGVQTSVKSLNDQWRAKFAECGEETFIGKLLAIECQGRTKFSYRSPMADHFVEEETT